MWPIERTWSRRWISSVFSPRSRPRWLGASRVLGLASRSSWARAGAGKTLALAAARMSWESSGYRVLGTALSARAARGLRDGAGIESQSLASLLAGIESGRTQLGACDVVVLDEAGMVGTRALTRIVQGAEVAGAKVVLVGDPRQLPNHHTFARTCGRWRLKFTCSAIVGHGRRSRPSNRAQWHG